MDINRINRECKENTITILIAMTLSFGFGLVIGVLFI